MKILILGLFIASAYAQDIPDTSFIGIPGIQMWAHERLLSAEHEFAGTRESSPVFWGDQIVYQIQVDRFNNGDFSNDERNIEPQQREHQNTNDLIGLPWYRHGGDIKGIKDRLDYIKDLGITSLWITPIFKHNGSYHGYCTTDFSQIDPGFGTKEGFRDLVKAAHARGIKVILDIVVNHMCDRNTLYGKKADHYKCAGELNHNNWWALGTESSGQGDINFGTEFFPPFKAQEFFNRCGANSSDDTGSTEPAAIYGDFVSVMYDFNTRSSEFQRLFTEMHKYWIAYADIDGFRMDAAKHVTEDFVAYFNTHVRAYARELGKKNFFIVGEVAGPADWQGRMLGRMFTNPANPDDHGNVPKSLTNMIWSLKDIYSKHESAPYPGLTAVYDFAQGGTAIDVLMGNRPSRALEEQYNSDYHRTIAGQNDYRLNWNLLEIHDWPRYASRAKNNMFKSMIGIAYLATAEGSPIIYYGMEQGFNGDCHFDNINAGSANDEIKRECTSGHNDVLFRQDMFINGPFRLGSTVKEIDELAYIGKVNKTAVKNDPYLNQNHTLYKFARKMLRIRKSSNALSYGTTKFRWVDSNNEGLLAFSRIDGLHQALVVINTGHYEYSLPELFVEDSSKGVKWINLLNASEYGTTVGNGKLNFNGLKLQQNSVMVFVREENVGNYDPYLDVHMTKN